MTKYAHPIEVIASADGRYAIMSELTRLENALQAEVKELPVKKFTE